jgi:hypothetical protein
MQKNLFESMIENEDCGTCQEEHSGQRAQVFCPFMSIGMIPIRRHCCDPDHHESDNSGYQIEQGVGALGQKTKTSSKEADQKLEHC